MFKAVIFDLDGTLVDTYPGLLESVNFVLQSFGRRTVDLQSVKKMVGRGLENLMLQAVGREHLQEGVRLFRSSYDRTHLTGSFLLPEVSETLRSLRERGVKMGVASNKPSDFSKSILRHLGIDSFFADCYGPDRGVPPKPAPGMLEAMMNLLQAEPEETLYVGDMALDVETAHNAGVRVALIPTGGDSIQDLKAVGPDFMLEKFSEVLSVLNSVPPG